MKDKFSNIWASYFYKVKATFVDSGSTAIYEALKLLNSKTVIVPTYTCHRILDTILKANCTPIIIDCDNSLQMDFNDIIYNDYADTIIVPHMFGIQSNIKEISKHTDLKINNVALIFGISNFNVCNVFESKTQNHIKELNRINNEYNK